MTVPRVMSAAEMVAPGSPEHARRVTASKVPAILGLNQFQTPSELWMEMSGLAPKQVVEGDRLDWGHDIEESLVRWWLRKNPGWRAGKGEVAYTNPELPFANQATLDRRAVRGRRFHIIECKSTDSERTWDSEDELPAHVYAQALAQMGISGIHRASVVRQLHSTVPVIYEVEWDTGRVWGGWLGGVSPLPWVWCYQVRRVGWCLSLRPSPREELQVMCAGRASPFSSPPRASGMTWSRLKAFGCCGGSCMSIGSPHIQQTAFSGCRV